MTRRIKNLVLGGATAALAMAGALSPSFAIEPNDFTNYLRGATQGLPLGAAPPHRHLCQLRAERDRIAGRNV